MGMKIDEYVNRVLRKFWPEDAKGDRRVWFHSQNLNEDRHGEPKGLPTTGRCWLHTPSGEFSFEWSAGSFYKLAGLHVQTNGESGGLSFHVGLFPVSLFWSVPVPFEFWKEYRYGSANFIDLNLNREDGSLHWQFGGDQHSWHSKTPKWKHGSFNFVDFALGKRKYVEGAPETHEVKIPMPEGAYDATIELRDDRWERPRWKTRGVRRAKVTVPLGIPFPGKGESDYDCGEDCSLGGTFPADTVEEAIGKEVESVFNRRRRYGRLMMKYPTPEERKAEKEAERAARAAMPPGEENAAEANMKPGRA